MTTEKPEQDSQLIALGELRRMVGVARKTIHKWLRAGGVLPAPVRISGRNYWYRAEIREWLAKQQRVEYPAETRAA